MVTFMPMMAFASTTTTSNVVWSDDFSTATQNGQTLEVRKTLGSDGVYEAKAYKNNEEIENSSVYFFDLSKASMNVGTVYDNTAYREMNGDPAVLKFTEGSTTYTVNSFQGWTATYKTDENLETEAVSADVSVEWSRVNEATGLERTSPKIIGTLAAKSVTVNPIAASVINDFFYSINDAGNKVYVQNVNAQYDGKEHELFIDDAAGYIKELQKYNASKANWEKVDAVKYKDKASQARYRAVFTKTSVTAGDHSQYVYVNVTVTARTSTTMSAQWTDANTTGTMGSRTYQVTTAQAADPRAFVEVTNKINNVSFDEEEVTAVFDELFTVEVKKNAIDENQQTWTIVARETSDSGWTAALKSTTEAHKTLFDNYSRLSSSLGNIRNTKPSVKANVTPDPEPVVVEKDDDITFSGVTTKAFKAKKKTKKLAKTKSFQITAVADSGNEITFAATTSNSKITVSNTGKVTVKKGLKKGTYKVTVKAKTAAGNGYKAAKETNVYTIKIK
jgi:hypothetical protein